MTRAVLKLTKNIYFSILSPRSTTFCFVSQKALGKTRITHEQKISPTIKICQYKSQNFIGGITELFRPGFSKT